MYVSDDGGDWLPAVAGLVLLVVIISAASAIVVDGLGAILISLGALCAGGLVTLAVLLRRSGMGAVARHPSSDGRGYPAGRAPRHQADPDRAARAGRAAHNPHREESTMTAIIIGAVLVYLAFHVGAGHAHHRYRKAHGLSPNFYWSAARGPYASVRLAGGWRVGHRL